MMKTYDIGIVGAGIAGLSTALALLKLGHNVSVFEQAQELSEVGAGLQLSSNATFVLNKWGVLESVVAAGFLPNGIEMRHWETGQSIAYFPQNRSVMPSNYPYVHIHRADLHTVLLDAVQHLNPDAIQTNSMVTSAYTEENAAYLTINKIKQKQFDWVIGADGIHSIIRTNLIGNDDPPQFTGNVAWRGLIPVGALNKKPKPSTHLVMGPKGHLVFYYVSKGEYLNYVAVVERSGWSKESWTEKGDIDELLQDFGGWNDEFLGILSKTNPDTCYRWALHDRIPLRRWSKGRCLILGDAAHPMLPFLAQGAAMGIEDAQALAHCFSTYPEEVVASEFYKLRKQRTAKVQRGARKNMSVFHEDKKVIQFARDNLLRTASVLYPGFMDFRLRWLYGYRFPTA